jgi:hypothetical protein
MFNLMKYNKTVTIISAPSIVKIWDHQGPEAFSGQPGREKRREI